VNESLVASWHARFLTHGVFAVITKLLLQSTSRAFAAATPIVWNQLSAITLNCYRRPSLLLLWCRDDVGDLEMPKHSSSETLTTYNELTLSFHDAY